MKLTIKHQDGCVIASTEGSIDSLAEDVFREQLHPLVRESATKLVLDVAGSRFLSSAGISAIVLLVTDANTCGSRIVFANPSKFVAKILVVTKLDAFLTVAPTVDEALKLLSRDEGAGEEQRGGVDSRISADT